MPDYNRLAGATDVSVEIFIFDPATGDPDSTVVFNTSGLDLEYRREGGLNVDITLVDLATPALDDPHLDNGFLLIGNGVYRLDLEDDVCAAGAKQATIHGTLTGRVIIGCTIHIDQEAKLSPTTEGQIDDIQATLLTLLLGFATFGTVNDASPATTGFTISSDFVDEDDQYNGLGCYVLSGDQRGRSALITDQTGLAITLSATETDLTAAPENGASIAIMRR